MSKYKIVDLIDKIFITTTIFLLIFAWINFYIRNLYLTFILSLIFTFACVYVLFYILNKKNEKAITKQKNQNDINENFLAFQLSAHEKKLKLMQEILSNNFETEVKNESLFYTDLNKKHMVIFATKFQTLTMENLISILDEFYTETVDVFDIICSESSINLNTKIFTNQEIKIIPKTELYENFFKKYNTFPNSDHINKSITKFSFKELIKCFFLPHKAKGYLLCGSILIFSSIILPFHIYYLIFGSILLAFSLACKLIPKLRKH